MQILAVILIIVWFACIGQASKHSTAIPHLIGSYAMSAVAPLMFIWMKSTGRSIDWDIQTAVLSTFAYIAILIAGVLIGHPEFSRYNQNILVASVGLSMILWSIIFHDGFVSLGELVGCCMIICGIIVAFHDNQ